VMVANWGRFKRHWHLFDALRELPSSLQVRLIGQPDRTYGLDNVRRQARDIGVTQNLEFFENLRVEQVQEQLANGRVSIILSRHEGYCGAVTESMFADTPVGVLNDAYIGSKAYINPVGSGEQSAIF
jgi:glycosyltransferase involved in cell wall biosynthesis